MMWVALEEIKSFAAYVVAARPIMGTRCLGAKVPFLQRSLRVGDLSLPSNKEGVEN
ncbi:MAG: hypothetical protein R2865_17375 [Deinococcales bacterium]